MIAVAKAGIEDGHPLIGGSLIVDPNGKIVAESSTETDEILVRACDLDLCTFGKETIFDFARHRRIEHYGLITERTGAELPPNELMFLDFTALLPQQRYKLLTATVVPRPIALVSTVSLRASSTPRLSVSSMSFRKIPRLPFSD